MQLKHVRLELLLSCRVSNNNLVPCRYFYAELHLGTPPNRFHVIVDTGSTMTYVPCVSCGSNCGTHHKVCPCGLAPACRQCRHRMRLLGHAHTTSLPSKHRWS